MVSTLTIKTLDGTTTELEYSLLDALRARTSGQVIDPESPGYEEARRVWNGMIDRRPAVIVRCESPEDVKGAIEFAREYKVPLAVRGGGHNVAGFGTCDGGLVIDLSPMRSVDLDVATGMVRVGGGATMGDVDRETQKSGLAIPRGIVSTTGVAGLTLGGGQGWLRRTFGMTCDSMVSAEVVTADGELLFASESSNSDLFWALRGGGGNFGVVTSFEFQAHSVGPVVAFAGPTYALGSTSRVLEGMRGFAETMADKVNLAANLWTVPPAPAFPENLHGQAVVTLAATFVGSVDQGEAVLMPLREIDDLVMDLSGPLPYVQLQQLFDPFFPAGELQHYWKSLYLFELDEAAISTMATFVANRPSQRSMVGVWVLGGAMGRIDSTATAAGDRSAPFLLEILSTWSEADEAEANISWARTFFDAMAPFASGKTNLNFPGYGNEPGFARAAMGENWDRLLDVKRRYDPTNLFRLNQNIDPTR
ncbi:MAG: FAD-binding oxidoreductase [Thermomicrobiales bacterium]